LGKKRTKKRKEYQSRSPKRQWTRRKRILRKREREKTRPIKKGYELPRVQSENWTFQQERQQYFDLHSPCQKLTKEEATKWGNGYDLENLRIFTRSPVSYLPIPYQSHKGGLGRSSRAGDFENRTQLDDRGRGGKTAVRGRYWQAFLKKRCLRDDEVKERGGRQKPNLTRVSGALHMKEEQGRDDLCPQGLRLWFEKTTQGGLYRQKKADLEVKSRRPNG